MSFVFYDTETTGTETSFDQILQFAAILTDEDLKIVERFEIRCRLMPHVVPSPGAINVNGVTVEQLTDASHPSHYEMVRAVREKLLYWSPSLFLGWNSIAFDEDIVRQALYKTLHGPYLTNTGGNSRSDVMRIAQACSLFSRDAIKFPRGEGGKHVFRLEEVAALNGFEGSPAHEALADVEATIFLAELISRKAPEVWSAFMRFSKKATVIAFIEEESVFCFNEFFFGNPFSCLATKIGKNKDNAAEWYIFNLGVDPSALFDLSGEELKARFSEYPKPVRRLRTNAAPILFSSDEAPAICYGKECDSDELARRIELLQTNDEFCERLVSQYEAQKKLYPLSPHVEKQIYAKFPTPPDEQLMESFHESPWDKRVPIVEKFLDERLRLIGRKLIHLERPDLLKPTVRREHDIADARRQLGEVEEVSWMTLPKALSELKEMIKSAKGAKNKLLSEHHGYLDARHKLLVATARA